MRRPIDSTPRPKKRVQKTSRKEHRKKLNQVNCCEIDSKSNSLDRRIGVVPDSNLPLPPAEMIRLRNGDEVPLKEAVTCYTSLEGRFNYRPENYRVMQAVAAGQGEAVTGTTAYQELRDAGAIRSDGSLRPPYQSVILSCVVEDGPTGPRLSPPCKAEDMQSWLAEKERQRKVMMTSYRSVGSAPSGGSGGLSSG
jgi:hypothetical protein